MEWVDFAKGGIGAIIGSMVTVVSFRSRLDRSEIKQMEIEKDYTELKTETLLMFSEIRNDIKQLLKEDQVIEI